MSVLTVSEPIVPISMRFFVVVPAPLFRPPGRVGEGQRASDAADGSRRRCVVGPSSSYGSRHRRGWWRRRIELRERRGKGAAPPLRPHCHRRPSSPPDLGGEGKGGAAIRPAVVVVVVVVVR